MGSVVAIIFALPLLPVYLPGIITGGIEIGNDLPSALSTIINIILEESRLDRWLTYFENTLPELIEKITASLNFLN